MPESAIPFKVVSAGDLEEAPSGAIPAVLYGAGSGGGGDFDGDEFLKKFNVGYEAPNIFGIEDNLDEYAGFHIVRVVSEEQVAETTFGMLVGPNDEGDGNKAALVLLAEGELNNVRLQTLSTSDMIEMGLIAYAEGTQARLGLAATSDIASVQMVVEPESGGTTGLHVLETETASEAHLFLQRPENIEFEDSTIMTAQTLQKLQGYDGGANQTLQHANGVFQWVTVG